MIKLVSTILILLGVTAVSAFGQRPAAEPLSYSDRTAIVISVLEPPTLFSIDHPFTVKIVSSDNLEFVDSSQLKQHGITLLSAGSLSEEKKDHVVYYLLFKNISFRDGVAVVKVAQVAEGRPCFGRPFHHESRYTYEVRRTSNGLAAKLIRNAAPLMSLDLKSVTTR